ncbi:MAG: hypothetical protein HYW57_09360, partial [Ignavibacteriales bacterium]|nr:hypothetical protein [Ignavibacteriales bacterium]
MKIFFRTVIGLSLLSVLLTAALVGAEKPEELKQGKGQSLNKAAAQTKNNAVLNINNFVTWMRADGQGQNPFDANFNGSQFPRGTSHPIFADNFVWGGKAYLDAARTQPAPIQLIRVGGGTYNVGNQVGWINGTGASATAVSTGDTRARIYRIRRDYTTMAAEELRRDAAENNLVGVSSVSDADVAVVVQQYATDWDEWPTDLGAPYIERNGIPGYQKPNVVGGKAVFDANFTVDSLISGNYDEPGVAGTDPKSPANQVIWTVFNDLNPTNMNNFAGSLPMGLEGQITLWGYKRGDALGNLYFNRIKLINKGGADVGGGAKGALYIDSMFVCQWSDPDLGNAGDDLSGNDSALGVGFVYNGNSVDADYARFNLPPPAIGYDFLAGPTVAGAPTDTAIFDLKKKGGFRNLPMTSFSWFAAGALDQPLFNYEISLRWWKSLRGFLANPSTAPDLFYPGPPGAPPTKFPLGGDPFAGTGSLDGLGTNYSPQPGDRRLVLSTGPFLLAPNDTQEVTMGVVAGLGGDRLSSVAVMKANDAAVQTTYNLVFQVSQAPASPIVTATELDGKVIIEWGSNVGRVKATETTVSQPGNYTFEGYNLYQLPLANSPRSEWRRIATYDVQNTTAVILDTEFDLTSGQFLSKPVQFGSNSGVKRYFELGRDYVRDIDKVYNGQEYYLVVTAYSRAIDAGFAAALESSPIVTTVRPKKPFGFTPNSEFADAVPVTKVGTSDG